MASSRAFRIGFRVCLVLVFVGSFVGFAYVDVLLKLALLRTGSLAEGSLAAKLYSTIPFEVRQNVYVFNVTNRAAFLAGAKPNFEQLGPYTFNLTLHKEMSWGANGSLTYKEKRIVKFVPELSAGKLTDKVYTVDPVFAMVQSLFDTLSPFVQAILRPVLRQRSILFEHTVDEILYSGYTDQLAKLAHLFRPDLPVIDGKIGYLRALNNSDDGRMTVWSGQANTLGKRNEISRWNGKRSIPYYNEPCNKLYGTNGELFPSFDLSEPPPQIDVFQPMFCKPWTLHFNGSKSLFGVELAKFNTQDDIFSPTGNAGLDRCLQPLGWLKGIFDISDCQHGFPALLSLPHFLRAEHCLDDVEGLKPDIDLHDFEMDVYALLGVPVRPAIRAQINVRIQREMSPQSPSIIYPVLWQEIVLAENSSRYLSSMIYYVATVPSVALSVLLWFIAGVAFIFLYREVKAYRKGDHTDEDDEQPIWSPADDMESDSEAPGNHENPSSRPT